MKRSLFMAATAASLIATEHEAEAVSLQRQQDYMQYMSQPLTLAQLKAEADAQATLETD